MPGVHGLCRITITIQKHEFESETLNYTLNITSPVRFTGPQIEKIRSKGWLINDAIL